jgi:putative heme-binding domain-containing protein
MKRLLLSASAAAVLSGSLFAQEKAANPLDVLVRTLTRIENPAVQVNILKGMNASLKGKRALAVPEGWNELYEKLKTSPNEEVRQQAQALAATFGGGGALDEMRQALADSTADEAARKAALDSLVAAKDGQALPLLLELIAQPGALRGPALRGLANYDDPRIATALIAGFGGFDSAEKRDALNVLLTRPATAKALIAAVESKTIERAAITAPLARQLQSLKEPEIDTWLARNWGMVKTTSAEKQAQIAKFKEFLTPDLIVRADASRGRAIFGQTCAVCHTMFGTGGTIGPELPGAYEDIDYLLQNILDPNAVIGKDYQQTFVRLKDGQSVSGIITSEDQSAVGLRTLGDTLTLQRGDIAEVQVSEQSMMPEGLLSALDEEGVRDLFAYLRQRQQVPMLLTAVNATDFFNGNDLSRWKGSNQAWKIEGGELIGRGNAERPESLLSDMVAKDFKLTGQIKVSGAQAAAELAFYGSTREGKFTGHALSFGGAHTASVWDYSAAQPKLLPQTAAFAPDAWTKCEITARGDKVAVALGDQPPIVIARAPETRTVIGFYLFGQGSELRVKDVTVEVPE